jgi:hypothetical protein
MGDGRIGDYSVKERLSTVTTGTGLRPDPAAFFVKTKKHDPTPARHPWRAAVFNGVK